MLKKLMFILLTVVAFAVADPIAVEARLTEIPGKMPSNDLYSYVYVFKYKVLKVESGSLDAKEVLVGVYNPLIARGKPTSPRATWASSRRRPSISSNLCRSKATGTVPLRTNTLMTNLRVTWLSRLMSDEVARFTRFVR